MKQQDSPAVALAREHAEAWTNHNYDKARQMLADDVRVDTTSTQPTIKPTHILGADKYMEGLIAFAQGIQAGSGEVVASIGDKQNSLILLVVKADFPGVGKVTLPAARLALWDENNKLKSEQVVFFALSD